MTDQDARGLLREIVQDWHGNGSVSPILLERAQAMVAPPRHEMRLPEHASNCAFNLPGTAPCDCGASYRRNAVSTVARGPIVEHGVGRCPDNDKRCHCEAGKGCPLVRSLSSHAVGRDCVTVPIVPTEDQWDGLARDVFMWLDMQAPGKDRSGWSLLDHLRRVRDDTPAWLIEECKDKGHLAKGDRAAIVYRLMLDAAPQAVLSQGLDSRPCTCHPDDNPPVPCPRKFALSECRKAAGVRVLTDFTDAEINAEFKRRNQPPPNPQAPTMKEPR